MTVADARAAGALLVLMIAAEVPASELSRPCRGETPAEAARRAEAIRRRVPAPGPGASPALTRAVAHLDAALAGRVAAPAAPF